MRQLIAEAKREDRPRPERQTRHLRAIKQNADKGIRKVSLKLNRKAFDHGKELINKGKVVWDERDAWSEHQPSAEKENEFIVSYGFDHYGEWYLGIDDEEAEHTKAKYKFPYGDFQKVHRCGVLSAESRAGQYKHHDIELAAAHLHGMIEETKR